MWESPVWCGKGEGDFPGLLACLLAREGLAVVGVAKRTAFPTVGIVISNFEICILVLSSYRARGNSVYSIVATLLSLRTTPELEREVERENTPVAAHGIDFPFSLFLFLLFLRRRRRKRK